MGIEPIMFVPIADGKINRSIATMEIIRIAFALIGAATMLAVIVIAIFGRDDDRLNEGLLIGIYVGSFWFNQRAFRFEVFRSVLMHATLKAPSETALNLAAAAVMSQVRYWH